MKLSGSKLPKWFDYIKENNPALYTTEFSTGGTLQNGVITYYELNIARKERMDIKIITERVNAINNYIRGYEAKTATAPDTQKQIEDTASPVYTDEDEIRIDEIPF